MTGPPNGTADVLITAPFTYRVLAPLALPCRQPKQEFHDWHHPLHRALVMEKLLIADPGLTPPQLAIKGGISIAPQRPPQFASFASSAEVRHRLTCSIQTARSNTLQVVRRLMRRS
jgi:hypothetical protein